MYTYIMAYSIIVINVFRYGVMRTDIKIRRSALWKKFPGKWRRWLWHNAWLQPAHTISWTRTSTHTRTHRHTHTHTHTYTHTHAHEKNIMAAPRFPASPADLRPTDHHYAAAVRFALLNRHPRSESIYPLRATCTRSDTKHTQSNTHAHAHTHIGFVDGQLHNIYFCTYTLYINERTLQYI